MNIKCCKCGKEYDLESNLYEIVDQKTKILRCPHCGFEHAVSFTPINELKDKKKKLRKVEKLDLAIYVSLCHSRIGDSVRDWEAACDATKKNWNPIKDAVFVTNISTSGKGTQAQAYKLQWRNKTDYPSGSFTDVGTSGDITYNAVTELVDDSIVYENEKGCTCSGFIWQDGLENEGDNLCPNSGTHSLPDGYYSELHWALDLDNALTGKEYEFQLYSVTEGVAVGIGLATIHMFTGTDIDFVGGFVRILGYEPPLDPPDAEDLYQADVANGWGVITKQGTNQYLLSAGIEISDGYWESYFEDVQRQLLFDDTVQYPFKTYEQSHLTLGELQNLANKLVAKGCHIKTEYDGAIMDFKGEINLYGCSITSTGLGGCNLNFSIKGTNVSRVWGLIADRINVTLSPVDTASLSLYRSNLQKGVMTNACTKAHVEIDDVLVHSNTGWGAWVAQSGHNYTIKNAVIKNNSDLLYASFWSGEVNFINCTVDNWTFYWSASPNAVVRRKNEFDVHCEDEDGNDLSGVSVVGEYIDPYGEAFSLSTDENGDIDTQTIEHGFFNQANGNTEQLKTPLKVTYSKAGYQTTPKYYDMTEKVKDKVTLLAALPAPLIPAQVKAKLSQV